MKVDEDVLFWFRNRFYRANHFAAAYAAVHPSERFEVLSYAKETFISLAMTKEGVYEDLENYIRDILAPMTHATDTQGGSRALPEARQPNPDYTRTSRPGYGSHQGPTYGYSQQDWNDYYAQWTDQEWEQWRRQRQQRQYRERRSNFPGYR